MMWEDLSYKSYDFYDKYGSEKYKKCLKIYNEDLKSDKFSSHLVEGLIFAKRVNYFISAINSLENEASSVNVNLKDTRLQKALLESVKKGELKIDLDNICCDMITDKIKAIIDEVHSDQARIKPTSPRVSRASSGRSMS